jgi:translocation protein SEC63
LRDVQVNGKKRPLFSRSQRYVNRFNIGLLVAWVVLLALGVFISTCKLKEAELFDPFEILGIPVTADAKQIKKAYRQMSRIHHPDKVSDPEQKKIAAEFFANKLSKAYQTLTDEVARENWIKHGHPDGQQAMSIGIALPTWFFAKDKKTAPLVLLFLAFSGLAVPILAISLYLWRSEGYVGANQVSEQTVMYYHRFGVKEMLRLTKMPEAIVPTQEFVSMGIKRETVRLYLAG